MSRQGHAQREELGSVEHIRDTLNDELPPNEEGTVAHAIPVATIERALVAARVTVDSEARGGPTESQLREAVIAVAAANLVGYDSTIKQIRGGDESVTFDTAAWASQLESNEQQALEHVKQFFAV